jgi:hypothetical protein
MDSSNADNAGGAPAPVKKHGFLDSGLADLTAAGISILSGMTAAWISINNSFFKNAEKYDVIEAEREMRDSKWIELKHKNITGHKLIEGVEQIEHEYSKGVGKRLKDLGVYYPWEKWHMLRPHQKTEVALSVAAVSGVAIGAMVNLRSNRNVAQRQNAIEQKVNDTMNEPSQQR